MSPKVSRAAVGRRSLSLAILASLLLVVGCDEEEEEPPPLPPAVPIDRPDVMSPRATSTRAAFDLALAGEGAVLVWGDPSRAGGTLHAAPLDGMGTPVGESVEIHRPDVPSTGNSVQRIAPHALEVAAVVAGGKLAVVWLEQEQVRFRIRGAVGDLDAGEFGPAHALAESEAERAGRRGHVAVGAADDGTFVSLHRGAGRRCGAPSSDEESESAPRPGGDGCVAFGVRTLRTDGVGGRGVPLSVPHPCSEAVAGVASSGGRWHYGICSEQGGSKQTTFYTIQFEPEYARSDEILDGCAPLGVVEALGGVVVVGRCGDDRRMAVFDAGAEGARETSFESRPVTCDGTTPVLALPDGRALELGPPMDRVEPLLPRELSENTGRAVWTGRSLIVAVSLGRDVSVRRYECEDGSFLRTDVL